MRTGIAPLLVVPAAVLLLAGGVVGLGTSIFIGSAIGGACAVAYIGWIVTRGGAALRAVGARPLADDDHPRFRNLAAGAAGDLGIGVPRLWLIPEQRPNALVAWSRGGNVALTEGAIEHSTRTEMEALVAACMVRVASGEAKRASMALGLGSLGRSLVRVGVALDVRAAALTRYPPALAAALRRCEPVEGHEPLWLVAKGPTHAGREDRAEALLDL